MYVRLHKLCKRDSYKYTGGCLIGAADPLAFAEKYFKKWVRTVPSLKKLIYEYQRDSAELDAKLEGF